jgi:hypothetical protein
VIDSVVKMSERRRLRAIKSRDPGYFVRLQTLIKLRDRATSGTKGYAEYRTQQPWNLEARTALSEILGEFHPLVEEIDPL